MGNSQQEIAFRAWRSAVVLNNAAVSLAAHDGGGANTTEAKHLLRESLNLVKVSCRYVEAKVTREDTAFHAQAKAILDQGEAISASPLVAEAFCLRKGPEERQHEGFPNNVQVLRSGGQGQDQEIQVPPSLTMLPSSTFVHIEERFDMQEGPFVPKAFIEEELQVHSGFILFNYAMIYMHEASLRTQGREGDSSHLAKIQCRALSLLKPAHALFSKTAMATRNESGFTLSYPDIVASYIHTIILDRLSSLSRIAGDFQSSIQAAACAEQMLARLHYINTLFGSASRACSAAPAA